MSPNPRSFTAWKYLGFAMAAPAMITALPTNDVQLQPAVVTAGGFQARRRDAEPQYPKLEVRQNNNSTDGQRGHKQPPDDNDDGSSSDDEDGISSDDESEDDEPGSSHSPSGVSRDVSTAIGAFPDSTDTPQADSLPPPGPPPQDPADEAREHWAIAVGSIAAFIAVCAFFFALWKFRAKIKGFRRKNGQNDFRVPPEKGPIITGPVGGFYPPAAVPSEVGSRERRSGLWGAPTTVTGISRDDRRFDNMPYPPAPALAPSTAGLDRADSRRKLIRRSLLHEEDIRRVPGAVPSEDGTMFYLEDELESGGGPGARRTKPDGLTIQVPTADGVRTFAAPAVPDSPEAAARRGRFSWVTPQDGQSVRSSMVSEPPRFRGVNSWVSNVAARTAKKAHIGGGVRESIATTAVPETPVEFRHHPGAEVRYGGGTRVDSSVLDYRLESRS